MSVAIKSKNRTEQNRTDQKRTNCCANQTNGPVCFFEVSSWLSAIPVEWQIFFSVLWQANVTFVAINNPGGGDIPRGSCLGWGISNPAIQQSSIQHPAFPIPAPGMLMRYTIIESHLLDNVSHTHQRKLCTHSAYSVPPGESILIFIRFCHKMKQISRLLCLELIANVLSLSQLRHFKSQKVTLHCMIHFYHRANHLNIVSTISSDNPQRCQRVYIAVL